MTNMIRDNELELLDDHESVIEERGELLADNSRTECHQCGNIYKQVAQHWSIGSCNWPLYTGKQWDILVGSVMGDGCVNHYGSGPTNPCVEIYNTNYDYLKYISKQFPVMMDGVVLKETAEQSSQYDRDSGWNPGADSDDYHDYYRIRTSCDERLKRLGNWYSSGKKVFPDNIELTPTIARHWYCQDGSRSHNIRRVNIHSVNESERGKNIISIFESVGFEVYYESDVIQFSVDESERFLEWISPAPDGMEYKWR